MKILKNIATLLFACLSLVSCNSDDDSNVIIPGPPIGTDLRYTVETSTNIISGIEFRDPTGAMKSATPITDSPNSWFRTVIVQIPFDAKVEAKFSNSTSVQQSYTIKVYVDGILTKTEEGTVLPASNGVDEDGDPIVIPGTITGTLNYQL